MCCGSGAILFDLLLVSFTFFCFVDVTVFCYGFPRILLVNCIVIVALFAVSRGRCVLDAILLRLRPDI